ncbi:hypothetical protein DPEC_G00015560 [Dallia pectoralis]|uniref:Uncharacterized protein n=1 Tax=Dallia pectoralis TaxID=75939 RepID=A0ACC2HMQ0_DALPE|nr:hypothetical protein DPEC_G00015560 [Dallia pectoralis]
MNTSEINSTIVDNLYISGCCIAASCAVNLVLSVPANGYVIYQILNGGMTALELFAFNLAVSENLFCLSSVLYAVSKFITTTPVVRAGKIALGFMFTGRPLFQCCICVERYLAVVHPVIFLKYKPLRYRLACCGAVWLLVLVVTLVCIFVTLSVYIYAVLVQNIILVCVMMFCCLSVLRALKRAGPGKGDREGTNMTKMKAFKIILLIQVTMLVSYVPLLTVSSLYLVLDVVVWHFSYSIIFLILLTTGLVQPLLHIHRAGKLSCIKA